MHKINFVDMNNKYKPFTNYLAVHLNKGRYIPEKGYTAHSYQLEYLLGTTQEYQKPILLPRSGVQR